jgi:RNA polymerase sigma factor (sigma-70 family)
MISRPTEQDVIELVAAAAAGDQQAWGRLVDQYSGLVSFVVASFRLSHAQQADVVAETWLRLVEHIATLRDPARVGSWLATTARREALAAARFNTRIQPVDAVDESPDPLAPNPEEVVLRDERCEAVRTALAQLPERQRSILSMLSVDPSPSYEEVAAALGLPVGSIGPTRARALRRLRTLLEQAEILATADGN